MKLIWINALILINTVSFDTFQFDKCINFDNLPGDGLAVSWWEAEGEGRHGSSSCAESSLSFSWIMCNWTHWI